MNSLPVSLKNILILTAHRAFLSTIHLYHGLSIMILVHEVMCITVKEKSFDFHLASCFNVSKVGYVLANSCLLWGLSAGYQPRPQVVDRGTTARYGGQLRYI